MLLQKIPVWTLCGIRWKAHSLPGQLAVDGVPKRICNDDGEIFGVDADQSQIEQGM